MENKTIQIEVEGGIVQEVHNLPKGWDYELIDKDIIEEIVYCNKCNKSIEKGDLNSNEQIELEEEGSFVCSDCINKEMDEDLK